MGCPGKDSMQIQDPRARLMVQKQEHSEYNLKKQTAVGAGHRTKGGYRCESRSSHLSAVFCIVFCGCSPQVLLSRILEKKPYILRILEKNPYILRKMSNTLYRMALKPILSPDNSVYNPKKHPKCSFLFFF